jgi:hypothetical protein
LIADVYKLITRPNGFDIIQHIEKPWAMATTDGWLEDGSPVELKNFANRDERGFPQVEFGAIRDVTPASIEWTHEPQTLRESQARRAWMSAYLQVQWALFITGQPSGLLSIWGRTSVYTYRIHANTEDQQTLQTAAKRFWTKHVLTMEPPPATIDDPGGGLADRIYDTSADDCQLDGSIDWAGRHDAYKALRDESRNAARGADVLKEQFKRTLKGAAGGCQNGVRYYVDGRGVWSKRKVNQ